MAYSNDIPAAEIMFVRTPVLSSVCHWNTRNLVPNNSNTALIKVAYDTKTGVFVLRFDWLLLISSVKFPSFESDLFAFHCTLPIGSLPFVEHFVICFGKCEWVAHHPECAHATKTKVSNHQRLLNLGVTPRVSLGEHTIRALTTKWIEGMVRWSHLVFQV